MSDINVQPSTAQVQLSSRGPRGPRGPAPEFRINDGVLEWRAIDPKNPQSWAPLVDLSEFLTDSEAAAEFARKWASEGEDVVVDEGLYSALHHALKAAASALTASTYAGDAAEAKAGAENARDLAKDWAEKADGQDVVGAGTRSAKHWASQASSHAATASGHAGTASSQAGIATVAAQDAADARDKAMAWAETTEDNEVEDGKYSAKHYAAKAAQSAEDAARFDPSSYYDKTTSDSRFTPASHVGAGGDAHAVATTSAAGFMSADDKATLNSISGGFGGKADLGENGLVLPEQLPLAEDEDVQGAEGTGLVNSAQVGLAIASLAGDVVREIFTSSGTFTKEDDDLAYFVEAWGGGGSGARYTGTVQGGGGGGGEYVSAFLLAADVPGSVSVTVGAGGGSVAADGNGQAGGHSSFGTHATSLGGRGGPASSGMAALPRTGGLSATNTDQQDIIIRLPQTHAGRGGAGGNALRGTGGDSVWGGAGGGGASSTNFHPGGTSEFGGNGGDAGDTAGQDGQAPGGGGGASRGTSGAGARGEVRVYRFKRIKQ